jgi:transcriptional regulator, LytR family
MTTLPNAGPGWSYDGQSIIIINQPAVDSLTEALKADRMQDFMNTYGSD